MIDTEVLNLTTQLINENDWLASCLKKFDVTNIGKIFDLTDVITKTTSKTQNIALSINKKQPQSNIKKTISVTNKEEKRTQASMIAKNKYVNKSKK